MNEREEENQEVVLVGGATEVTLRTAAIIDTFMPFGRRPGDNSLDSFYDTSTMLRSLMRMGGGGEIFPSRTDTESEDDDSSVEGGEEEEEANRAKKKKPHEVFVTLIERGDKLPRSCSFDSYEEKEEKEEDVSLPIVLDQVEGCPYLDLESPSLSSRRERSSGDGDDDTDTLPPLISRLEEARMMEVEIELEQENRSRRMPPLAIPALLNRPIQEEGSDVESDPDDYRGLPELVTRYYYSSSSEENDLGNESSDDDDSTSEPPPLLSQLESIAVDDYDTDTSPPLRSQRESISYDDDDDGDGGVDTDSEQSDAAPPLQPPWESIDAEQSGDANSDGMLSLENRSDRLPSLAIPALLSRPIPTEVVNPRDVEIDPDSSEECLREMTTTTPCIFERKNDWRQSPEIHLLMWNGCRY